MSAINMARMSDLTSVGKDRGSGTTYPTTNLVRGDVYYHTGLQTLMVWNGLTWRQTHVPVLANFTEMIAMSTTWSSALYTGFEVKAGVTPAIWQGVNWGYTLFGVVNGTADGNGVLIANHGGHTTPFTWGASLVGYSTDAIQVVIKVLAWTQNATQLQARFVRTDNSTYFGGNPVGFSWWARW